MLKPRDQEVNGYYHHGQEDSRLELFYTTAARLLKSRKIVGEKECDLGRKKVFETHRCAGDVGISSHTGGGRDQVYVKVREVETVLC